MQKFETVQVINNATGINLRNLNSTKLPSSKIFRKREAYCSLSLLCRNQILQEKWGSTLKHRSLRDHWVKIILFWESEWLKILHGNLPALVYMLYAGVMRKSFLIRPNANFQLTWKLNSNFRDCDSSLFAVRGPGKKKKKEKTLHGFSIRKIEVTRG